MKNKKLTHKRMRRGIMCIKIEQCQTVDSGIKYP